MSAAEKKVAALLVVILIAMIAVYFSTNSKRPAGAAMAQPMPGPRPAGMRPADIGDSASANCPTGTTGSGAAFAKTEELGKPGAKLDIIAVVPVAHGCHATSVAELKKAYQAHPKDIHLTIVDKDGPDAAKYAGKVGSPYTRITVNGKYQFDVGGRKVALEKAEGMTYQTSDIGPVVTAQLAGK